MLHPIHETYAKLLVDYCLEVKPGDRVAINVETPALAMARAVTREVLKAGGFPLLRLSYPELALDVLTLASDAYFDSEPSVELSEVQQVQAWLRIGAPTNTRLLQGVDKTRITRLARRNRPVQDYRIQHTRWCGTLYPTAAAAQDAGMDLDSYERFVYGAMFLFEDDPVAEWLALEREQARLIERLSRADEVHITAPGTDLRLRVKGRRWVNSAGRRNMPSGEVFTGPLEHSATGVITFDVPSNVSGVAVEGIRLTFEGGKVVGAQADKGGDLLLAQLESDEGARYLGELGIGTNPHITVPTRSILFDEKMAGTVHLALGQSYPETGGVNRSAIHWDMVCDLRRGGRIYLDGELFQENGRFVGQ